MQVLKWVHTSLPRWSLTPYCLKEESKQTGKKEHKNETLQTKCQLETNWTIKCVKVCYAPDAVLGRDLSVIIRCGKVRCSRSNEAENTLTRFFFLEIVCLIVMVRTTISMIALGLQLP